MFSSVSFYNWLNSISFKKILLVIYGHDSGHTNGYIYAPSLQRFSISLISRTVLAPDLVDLYL
jgi:hypothetical protein